MDRIYDLQCEYKKNPMQVDIKNPRFSWKVQAEGYNVIQIKWELDVLEQISKRVVWSVSEESNRTVHIVYDGEPLQENKKYTWRVKSTLKDGRVLTSSGNDFFETGFFEADIWKGIWIGKKDREDLGNCPLFRKEVEVKEKCTRAKLFISARGLYEVSINGNIQDEYLLAQDGRTISIINSI